ncbi:MAG: phosphoglycerate dehydrogenase [Nitrosomonas sp.]|nr:phosphoglycerate dehydrogenase [Nitrosomonas sp.]
MNKIIISTSSFNLDNNPVIQQLLSHGINITSNPYRRKLTEDEIMTLLGSDTVGLIAGVEPLTRRVLSAASGLRMISRCGTGLDNVDLEAVEQLNIRIANTPEAPAQAVAELTLGLMLACLRQIPQTDRLIRQGAWPRTQGHLLAAQTIGIVGLGHIGQRVARLCQAFGANVIAHDPYLQAATETTTEAIPLIPLENLLMQSDVITLHLPYSSKTHHLLDKHAIAQIKPGAILINAARGGLVDEVALDAALSSGHLSTAALDSFEQEPYHGALCNQDNIILTSHIGSLASEARHRMEIEAAENLWTGLIQVGIIDAAD